nr:MAG TPA: hypothetical protein [Bacteriophage sp.]
MKKLVVMVTVVVLMAVGFIWWLTPVQPHHYMLHVVKGGETITSIVLDANRNSNIDYDIREAAATAVAESKKMEGGIASYLIHPGDKVAVPIYK